MSRRRTLSTAVTVLVAAAVWAGVTAAAPLPALVPEPTEAEIQTEYDRARTSWLSRTAGQKEHDVRHILLASRSEAEATLMRLSQGEKFEDLARLLSRDPGSAVRGGSLGWSMPADFVEPFAAAMVALGPAGMSRDPVQTAFGWHVIEVLAVREASFPPLEQVKDRVRWAVQRSKERWQQYDVALGTSREVDVASVQARGDKVFFQYRERSTYAGLPPRTYPSIVAVADCERRERSDVASDGSFEMRQVFPDTAQARQVKLVCDRAAENAAAATASAAPLPDVGLSCDSPQAEFPPELGAATSFKGGTVVVRGQLVPPASAIGEVLVEAPSGYPAVDAAAVKAFRSMKCSTRVPLKEARWVRRSFHFTRGGGQQ